MVYADNEEVIMVYVTSMTTAPGGDDDDVTPGAVGNVTATGNRELSDAISNDPGFSGLGITDTEIREAVNAMEITLEKGESKTDSDTGVTTTPITITGSIQKTDSLSKAWKDNAERYYLILNIEAPSTINATEVELGNGNTSDVEDGSFVLILGLSDVTNSHTVSMTWKDASGNEVKTAIVLDMYDLDFTEST